MSLTELIGVLDFLPRPRFSAQIKYWRLGYVYVFDQGKHSLGASRMSQSRTTLQLVINVLTSFSKGTPTVHKTKELSFRSQCISLLRKLFKKKRKRKKKDRKKAESGHQPAPAYVQDTLQPNARVLGPTAKVGPSAVAGDATLCPANTTGVPA